MKNISSAVCAAMLLASANPSFAAEDDALNFVGTFTCKTYTYDTEWVVTKELGSEGISASVYYTRTDYDHVLWLQLKEHLEADGNVLRDANGNPFFRVEAGSAGINAAWVKNAPDSDCQPFEVTRTTSAKARYDDLFTMLSGSVDDEAAKKIALQKAPILFALPELDQQGYSERHHSLLNEFWSKYARSIRDFIETAPLATVEERAAYHQRLLGLNDSVFTSALRRIDLDKLLRSWTASVDRYAYGGGKPTEELFTGSDAVCKRVEAVSKADPNYDFAKLEFAAGMPGDYWTRDIAEDVLKGLRACPSATRYAQNLPKEWTNITQHQEVARSLRAEQARLLSLQLNVETLIETKNLRPDPNAIGNISSATKIYARYFNEPLDERRKELVDAGTSAIEQLAAEYDLENDEGSDVLENLCGVLKGVVPSNDRSLISAKCEDATRLLEARQITQATEIINAAFEGAEPESEAAKAADALCSTMREKVSYRVSSDISELCRRHSTALEEILEARRCAVAIADTEASTELLASTIKNPIRDEQVAIEDIICGDFVRSRDIKVTRSPVRLERNRRDCSTSSSSSWRNLRVRLIGLFI
jgi:hypothetical protein